MKNAENWTYILIYVVSKYKSNYGGVGGIRTLGRLLTVTRFPVVLRLCTIFEFPFEPFIVIVRLSVFSK